MLRTDPPTVLVLYHYLHPDDVVSAVEFSELAAGLAARGWRVIASCSNRSWQDDAHEYPARSSWKDVDIRRVRRPGFRQASAIGRLMNAAWMIGAWSLLAFDRKLQPDVIVVGTDPVLSPVIALAWKALRPRVRLAHWCFDLYPEAALADGILAEKSVPAKLFKGLMKRAYQRFDVIADIGVCMRERLLEYRPHASAETITPWAMVEPDSPAQIPGQVRRELFGDATFGVLYSGSFGRAHTWQGIPELARALQPLGGRIVFGVRGNAVEKLRKTMADAKAPVDFADFVGSVSLHSRLAAADVHIVSLREEWTGTVVPSKFFGALAMGRPVLFVGSERSAIARWIRQFEVGWVLSPGNAASLARELAQWCRNPAEKARLFAHCHAVYRQEFSRKPALDRWDRALRSLSDQPLDLPIEDTPVCR